MATNHNSYAALAVVIVIAAAGLPVLTGHATANYYDFSVADLTYPDTKLGFPLAATVTVYNAGSTSASYVRYTYEILAQNGQHRYSYQDYIPVIPAQGSVMVTTPADTGLKAGAYMVKFLVDSDRRFDELDEADNHYETTLVVK